VKVWGSEAETLIPPRHILIIVKLFPNRLFGPENLTETMCECSVRSFPTVRFEVNFVKFKLKWRKQSKKLRDIF